ncbi:hypothetical protein Pmar_PMAR007211 [Perkinsus marinus ATCC 50983]|uniref:Uncharacterized protein n=1 Tax=Perkinsus marinus (strain ATCC 50983 / TXsc) TaxID=423536 RepID=C5LWN5_PERM5|nr:hypothetical protein Pmar_PMAR007211 [Perkinsus marinus ATCC 50983]EEQ98830.1 hypothetical protein Pmar_PMAR007211 [Perkinsus marinus ATCC 50983]|eukprot:XP_002766113.1 hypothetical protein Pmar_PMAR007211 [Perkinsus marinus ATCC 50983]
MPVDPITGSALAVKALCVLPLKVAAVGGGYHTAATAVVAAAPTPEITSFGAYGPPEITTMQPTVQLNPAGAPLPTVDVPPPPELTFPPDVFTNIEGLVNSITLPDPTTFTAGAPGTYHEFPGPIDISTGHAVPSVDGEIRTAADLGMQDLVDRANALNKQLFGHPNTGVPSQMYKDVYNEIVNRAHALGRYDVFPRIGSAITDAIGSQPELTPVEPSGVNGVFIPVIEAVRATCGDCCRRPVTQGSSSSSSFLDVEDTSCLRRVLAETYTAYAEAWIGISSALHEIMAA